MRFSLYEYSLNGFWPFLAIITALPESQIFTLWPLATAASASLNEKSSDIEPTSKENTPNVNSAIVSLLVNSENEKIRSCEDQEGLSSQLLNLSASQLHSHTTATPSYRSLS